LKIIQSTDTFQRSRRLSNWDQTGQKWQSEQSKDSQAKLTPKSNEPQTKPQVLQTLEPAGKTADLRGKEPEAISFKRQIQKDTFNGSTPNIARTKAKPHETAKTVLTAAFGLCCLAVGSLTKSKII